jgi:hypothetical protein
MTRSVCALQHNEAYSASQAGVLQRTMFSACRATAQALPDLAGDEKRDFAYFGTMPVKT